MEKVKLEICCGTACYMLGAKKLLEIEENMPEDWRGRVEVIALPCLNLCTDENLAGAPFVRVNGQVLGKATVDTVTEAVRAELEGGKHD